MQNKKAAMEMSVGTIVTIVLLMSVLVLGIFLIRQIFKSGTGAIENVDAQIQSEINKMFANEEKSLITYPNSEEIVVTRGETPFKGFAFVLRNEDGGNIQTYTYNVSASIIPKKCGSLTLEEANGYVMVSEKQFEVGRGDTINKMVRFDVPKNAPACSVYYVLKIKGDKGQLEELERLITFK